MASKKSAAKKTKPSAAKEVAKETEARSVLEEAYDEFPYESYVYPQTHPARMHTIAKLFGLKPADIQTARILEIGCAGGGNIIPIAIQYPKTKSLAIDLSKEQIVEANKNKEAMGLKNVEFKQLDITKFKKDAGEFDYIICHGVYSWVPAPVQKAIMNVCRNNLAKNGLAIISFNVLPGWSAVKSLREMMIYHTKNFKDPRQQIDEAKKLLNFLYENTPPNNESYRKTIESERKILSTTNDSYVFHEHLESENHQFYLHEFAANAADADLCYVGDAEISSMYLGNYSAGARKTLGAIPDIIRQEQYIDFLSNRRFRHAILTHKEQASTIKRTLEANRINEFYVQARFKFDPASEKEAEAKFVSIANAQAHFKTPDKKTATMLKMLADHNKPIKIDALAALARKEENIEEQFTKNFFIRSGFNLALQNYITLHSETFEFPQTPGKKPKAYAWAARQIQTGTKTMRTVTNQKRDSVALTPFNKALLTLADGTRTVDDLVDVLTGYVVKGDLKMQKNNAPITDKAQIRSELQKQVPHGLKWLSLTALLEA